MKMKSAESGVMSFISLSPKNNTFKNKYSRIHSNALKRHIVASICLFFGVSARGTVFEVT